MIGILLQHLDRFFNRLYSSKYNPIYRSGSIAIGLFVIALITGLYLVFFYRLGQPYESIKALNDNLWFGSWVRGVHRYSSDLMVVAVLFHILRMIAQKKASGPRTLAWLTGVLLLILMLAAGWTGYVMVWDAQGQALARAGAKIFDSLNIFSDPIILSFSGISGAPASFFFLNLFLHVAIPLGMIFGVWVHTSKIARSEWLPDKKILGGMIGILIFISIIWPAPLGPKANLLQEFQEFPIAWLFNFWIPLAETSPMLVFFLFVAVIVILGAAPWYLKSQKKLGASYNDPNICQGCTQCVQDCPYEAIQMVSMEVHSKMKSVAQVDPALCVSCGLCSASCEPMTIGPEGRKAGDQLKTLRNFLASLGGKEITGKQILIVTCLNQISVTSKINDYCKQNTQYQVYPVACPGTIHAVVYSLMAANFSKVIIASCPDKNCCNKDGFMLLTERAAGKREPTFTSDNLREKIHIIQVGPGEEDNFFEAVEKKDFPLDTHLKRSLKEKITAILITAVLVGFIAGLTRIPAPKNADTGILRINIRLVGQNEKICQEHTKEELSKIPVHMRALELCTYRALSYQLKLNIDGKEHLNEEVRPGGFRKDRPIYVSQEINLKPGTHKIEFYLEPLNTKNPSIIRLELAQEVQFYSNQVSLIYYSPDKKNAVLRGAAR